MSIEGEMLKITFEEKEEIFCSINQLEGRKKTVLLLNHHHHHYDYQEKLNERANDDEDYYFTPAPRRLPFHFISIHVK